MNACRPFLLLTLLAAALAAPPAASAQAAPAAERDGRPTLFYIGDSTVRNGSGSGGNGQWGWGSVTDVYFDTTKVRIANRAIGGRSSRTFFTEGRWDRVLEEMRPGDVVVIQFGHNDGGLVNDTARARGSLRGVGEETQEIDNLMTKRHEVVHTYGWYLRRYVADARAKGAVPVIASHVPRNIHQSGAFVRNHDSYAGWAAEVARAEGVPFIDLNELIAREFDRLGPEAVAGLFQGDHTHTSLEGAKLNARVVVAALQGLPQNPVAAWLSAEGQAVEPLAP
jgi:lysophospholipase L1-like esterase